MKHYIDKSAVVAEIERIMNEQQEICKADVALDKVPNPKNIEVIYQFQEFTKFLDTLEVKEIGVSIGSPEDDYNSKTVQVIDADGNIKEITVNKAQNGKSVLEAAKEEKVDNQNCVKPADKVEPKFHEGDWVVFNNNHQSVYQIERIDNYRYYLRHYLGGSLSVHFDNELIRAWTIQDARAGDVLEFGDHGRLVSGIVSYVNKTTGKVDVNCLLENNNFKVGNYYNLDTIKPHPATKEQRDLLFQKMHEAGYEWDAEKKELKLLITNGGDFLESENREQNPAWSEDDDGLLELTVAAIEDFYDDKNPLRHRLIDWLKSLKQRIGG